MTVQVGRAVVRGIAISNADRELQPTGLTKLELARYYERVGEWMLPHVRARPLSLLRWAEGRETPKGGVFLRHRRAWGPQELRRVLIEEKTKTGEYLVVDTPAGLVALAQMDILEIHTWSSTAEDLERPDRLVFDLDPAPDVPWTHVVDAARDVRGRLRAIGLESWVKTTGGKGLHVVAPLVPSAGWDLCFELTRALARELVTATPSLYVASMSKAARQGRIFVDYLRNNRTNTSIAAYSTRARPGAPVSVPITWEELDSVRPASLVPEVVLARLKTMRDDPWRGYWTAKQALPATLG